MTLWQDEEDEEVDVTSMKEDDEGDGSSQSTNSFLSLSLIQSREVNKHSVCNA